MVVGVDGVQVDTTRSPQWPEKGTTGSQRSSSFNSQDLLLISLNLVRLRVVLALGSAPVCEQGLGRSDLVDELPLRHTHNERIDQANARPNYQAQGHPSSLLRKDHQAPTMVDRCRADTPRLPSAVMSTISAR